MRILLRNSSNGMFYAGRNRWTPGKNEAFSFEDTSLAIDRVCEEHLGNMEVVMQFDSPDYEIPMTVSGVGEMPLAPG